MVVMDVRTAEELAEKGVIDTGDVELVVIPLQDFIAQMSEWPAADADISSLLRLRTSLHDGTHYLGILRLRYRQQPQGRFWCLG